MPDFIIMVGWDEVDFYFFCMQEKIGRVWLQCQAGRREFLPILAYESCKQVQGSENLSMNLRNSISKFMELIGLIEFSSNGSCKHEF